MCLLRPLKGRQRVGPGGHHPVTPRQTGARRGAARAGAVLGRAAGPDARLAPKARDAVERASGVLTRTAGGPAPLPAWVRTLPRVRRWVGAKRIPYDARLKAQEARGRRRLTAAA